MGLGFLPLNYFATHKMGVELTIYIDIEEFKENMILRIVYSSNKLTN